MTFCGARSRLLAQRRYAWLIRCRFGLCGAICMVCRSVTLESWSTTRLPPNHLRRIPLFGDHVIITSAATLCRTTFVFNILLITGSSSHFFSHQLALVLQQHFPFSYQYSVNIGRHRHFERQIMWGADGGFGTRHQRYHVGSGCEWMDRFMSYNIRGFLEDLFHHNSF